MRERGKEQRAEGLGFFITLCSFLLHPSSTTNFSSLQKVKIQFASSHVSIHDLARK
jgi:hypothetical protein